MKKELISVIAFTFLFSFSMFGQTTNAALEINDATVTTTKKINSKKSSSQNKVLAKKQLNPEGYQQAKVLFKQEYPNPTKAQIENFLKDWK